MFALPILMGTRDDLDDVIAAVAKVAAARAGDIAHAGVG